MSALLLRQIEALVGTVRVKEAAVVPDRLARPERLADVLLDFGGGVRQRQRDREFADGFGFTRANRHANAFNDARRTVACPAALAFSKEAFVIDEVLEAI